MEAPDGALSATTSATTATTAQLPATMEPDDRVVSSITAPLPAPPGLVAEYIGGGYYSFAWSPVPGAEYYELAVQHPQCGSCKMNLDPITDTAYVVAQGRLDYTGEPDSAGKCAARNRRHDDPGTFDGLGAERNGHIG